VFAFEPLPANVSLLRQNIQGNPIANVQILEVAASDRCGEAVIRVAENPATASLIWHRGNPSATEIIVKTVIIDDLVESGQLSAPKFVKIDVEGAEGHVLRGMRRSIAKARPVLFIECSDAGREMAWQFLTGLNYRCQSAITQKSVRSFEEYRHADFLWLPSSP
jgi:FkbM family methyltransferase